MLVNFTIPVNSQAQILQPSEGVMYMLYLQNSSIWCKQAPQEFIGNWDEVQWTSPTQVFSEEGIVDFQATMSEGEYLLILYTTKNGTQKVAVWPGEFPLYGNQDPYRIYWGTDTHILYMNVENTWVPVSVMDEEGTAGVIEFTRKEW